MLETLHSAPAGGIQLMVRRNIARWTVGLTILLLLAISAPAVAPAWAQDVETETGPDWSGVLPDPVRSIFRPIRATLVVGTDIPHPGVGSGAAQSTGFVLIERGLLRSDDGGASFRSVAPPWSGNTSRSRPVIVQVDPTDPNTVYASGSEGVSAHSVSSTSEGLVYRTTDAGATWQSILPTPSPSDGKLVAAITVSPADHNRLYVLTGYQGVPSTLVTSSDGGATWTSRPNQDAGTCGVHLLQAHPTDPQRLFLSNNCDSRAAPVQQSTDGGQIFRQFWPASTGGYPLRLVGGAGSAPGRWYLAVTSDVTTCVCGASVLRSDDDGISWAPVLTYAPDPDPLAPRIRISGLDYDPTNPDTVYVARVLYDPSQRGADSVVTSGLAVSSDGGSTWSDLGGQQMGQVTDLAVSSDARTLYLGSDQGLFQLALGS